MWSEELCIVDDDESLITLARKRINEKGPQFLGVDESMFLKLAACSQNTLLCSLLHGYIFSLVGVYFPAKSCRLYVLGFFSNYCFVSI